MAPCDCWSCQRGNQPQFCLRGVVASDAPTRPMRITTPGGMEVPLFDPPKVASQAVGNGPDDTNAARAIAVDAIRNLELKMAKEFPQGGMLGMPNLGSKRSPLHGARVRGIFPNKPMQIQDGWTLVVNEWGQLVLAHLVGTPGGRLKMVVARPDDSSLRIEDMEAYARVLAMCLQRHLERVDQRAAAFDRVKSFAARLAAAVAS